MSTLTVAMDGLSTLPRSSHEGPRARPTSCELSRDGPPPYFDVLAYDAALSSEQDVHPEDHSANSEGAGQMGENILVERYTFLEQVHLWVPPGRLSVVYPQLQEINFRTQVT